jgi:hypothetical protein
MNTKNQDSPEVGDIIQCIVGGGTLAYLTITAKTEKPYNITVEKTYLENEAEIYEAIYLAANSGDQLYETGVWYAKMYSISVVPSGAEYNGRNYADFSQVDTEGNPIIVIYEGQNGTWVEIDRVTPPAEYNGYMTITSKIWDIVEQSGQQGGKVLWSHNQKTFTPYPQIISFENIEITGDSTVIMPQNPGANQIVNKDYVDEAIASIPTPTADVTQSIDAEIVGTLTITDNSVVSGFTDAAGDYLKISGFYDMTGVSSFEIGAGFEIYAAGNQAIFGQTNSPIYIRLSNGVIRVKYDDGTSTQTVDGTTVLQGQTRYYVRFKYDGTNYTVELSTDGVNYTQEASVVAQRIPCKNTDAYRIGSTSTTITTAYMEDWYIKVNGQTIWSGMDAPGLHQRVAKGHEVIAFQTPTASNDYTWYRKYADGWVEQGGYATTSGNTGAQITLPVTMSDAHYLINGTCNNDTTGGVFHFMIYENQTTTGFAASPAYAGEWRTGAFYWEVRGMAQG